MYYKNEMVPPPLALEMGLFERKKVVKEGLETDSGSVEFLATKGRGRLIERERKTFLEPFLCLPPGLLKLSEGLRICSSVVEHLPNMYKAVSITSTSRRKRKKKYWEPSEEQPCKMSYQSELHFELCSRCGALQGWQGIPCIWQ